MKNELIQLFMNDWNETRYGALTVVVNEAVTVLHNHNVPGVLVDMEYNVAEPFHKQPENIRLMVQEAQEAATAYLTAQPEYHEALERKAKNTDPTPEELYYLKHGTKGEF